MPENPSIKNCVCGTEPLSLDATGLVFIVRCPACGRKTDMERSEVDAIDSWNAGRIKVPRAPRTSKGADHG